MKNRIFMDTAFLLATIDASDKYHTRAQKTYEHLSRGRWAIITTDAILVELGNGLAKIRWRQIAHTWITRVRGSQTLFTVVPIDQGILTQAIALYGTRQDKEWGLTDCTSSIVMQEYGLSKSLRGCLKNNIPITLLHLFESIMRLLPVFPSA
jgi:predicted nucleic acid-binding protein